MLPDYSVPLTGQPALFQSAHALFPFFTSFKVTPHYTHIERGHAANEALKVHYHTLKVDPLTYPVHTSGGLDLGGRKGLLGGPHGGKQPSAISSLPYITVYIY